ncbi:capsule biosynthesis GfcC family protein [Pectobacterium punjabense]|uniref:capsule biosynthesis GfcC family protein n=1 Tax=Pectobacterium punjabense TaxID=2108399 RepID=UPI00240621EA|nr:capsule biosynthesis GfcC D2 domain-containing protein [Pectobacterium punjabense]MDG0796869.1 capsule biosynthesis GfcC family protein [Pectobacterium punjabense]
MLALNRITALLLLVSGVAMSAQLTVKSPQQTIAVVKLEDGTRLDKFYEQVPWPQNINWRTAFISDFATTQNVRAQGDALLQKLAELETSWRNSGDGDLAISAWLLRKAISPINVAGRIRTDLDPDDVRVHIENNRPLVGEYALYVAPHDDRLSLIGLVNTSADVGELEISGKVALRAGWSVEDYLAGRRLIAGADNSYGYLIGGNGHWRKVPLALWNRQHIEPAAGEMLFIGFDPSVLPQDMSSLNDQLADYLANRTPLE